VAPPDAASLDLTTEERAEPCFEELARYAADHGDHQAPRPLLIGAHKRKSPTDHRPPAR
jgi:hypothetical protein